MVSAYSVCSAIIFYNISLILVFLLRRKVRFLAGYSTSILLLITALGLVRLFTPLDIEQSIVICSTHAFPAIRDILQFELPLLNISMGLLLLAVWGCGTVGFAIRDIASELRSWRARKNYTTLEDSRTEKIAASFGGKYRVKVSPKVKEPYVAGIFRPTIYLPPMTLTDDDLHFILRHEIQHILSHDGLIKLLFLIIEALFWWNPLAHITMKEIDAILELRCDGKITQGLDDKAVCDYMCTLLSVMKQMKCGDEPQCVGALYLAENTPVIKQRFEVMINRDKKKSRTIRQLLCCIIVIAFFMSYLVIIQPYYGAPKSEIDGYVSITPDNAYVIYDNGEYYLYIRDMPVEIITEGELNDAPYNQLKIKGA